MLPTTRTWITDCDAALTVLGVVDRHGCVVDEGRRVNLCASVDVWSSESTR